MKTKRSVSSYVFLFLLSCFYGGEYLLEIPQEIIPRSHWLGLVTCLCLINGSDMAVIGFDQSCMVHSFWGWQWTAFLSTWLYGKWLPRQNFLWEEEEDGINVYLKDLKQVHSSLDLSSSTDKLRILEKWASNEQIIITESMDYVPLRNGVKTSLRGFGWVKAIVCALECHCLRSLKVLSHQLPDRQTHYVFQLP